MLVFVSDFKRFDEKKLKNPRVVFIWKNRKLYEDLENRYKVVLIDENGRIDSNNFFPKSEYEKKILKKIYEERLNVYGYVKKRFYQIQSREIIMRSGFKDTGYRVVYETVWDIFDKDFREAKDFMTMNILKELFNIARFERGSRFVKELERYLFITYNVIDFFFTGYVYSVGRYRKEADILGDVFRFNILADVFFAYPPTKKDIYKNTIDKSYFRILARVFIENIHQFDVKENIDFRLKEIKT